MGAIKLARIATKLQEHQQRVVDRIQREDQPGLVVAHGMGSGKTLTGIAAADAIGGNANVIVPAALQTNFKKEINKHIAEPNAKFKIDSLQRVGRARHVDDSDTMIVDEAHRLRETSGQTSQAIAKAKAKKRLLLTGTPFYNHPHDISQLVNIASGEKTLPGSRQDFEKKYVENVAQKPGLLARTFRGIKPGEVKALKNTEELQGILQKWVDYHENTQDGFAQRNDVTVETPLTKKQQEHYQDLLGEAPPWLRYKIKKGLPPTKQEAANLNAFLSGIRQVSVSPGGFDHELTPEGAAEHSSKIQEAANRLQERLKANPQHRAVIYSNFLDSGINPYSAELTRRGIQHGTFTGRQTKQERDAQVKDYNEGRTPVLMLSSAGGEGLDLQGTRQIQLLDPHFNKEKLEQVIARGIRYKSHDHLTPENRNVDVEHYVGTMPEPGRVKKLFGAKREKGVDEYLRQLSADKDRLNEQMRGLLRPKVAKARVDLRLVHNLQDSSWR
jgi:SNF2 family DNA or RNA helicase